MQTPMTRTINNLAFRVHSPSCLELIHSWTDVLVFVQFNGFKWTIRYSDPVRGVTRFFGSRDEAIELLAGRQT